MRLSNTRWNVCIYNNYWKQTKNGNKITPQMTLPHDWIAFLTHGLSLYIFLIMLGVEWCYHVANLVEYNNFNKYGLMIFASFGVHCHLHCRLWDHFGLQRYGRTPIVSYIKITVLVQYNGQFGCQVFYRWF